MMLQCGDNKVRVMLTNRQLPHREELSKKCPLSNKCPPSHLMSIIFLDAAWSPGPNGRSAVVGSGIFIQLRGGRRCSQLCISAISSPATSAIQAEAFSLILASQIVGIFQI
jgi:hypothetical protein